MKISTCKNYGTIKFLHHRLANILILNEWDRSSLEGVQGAGHHGLNSCFHSLGLVNASKPQLPSGGSRGRAEKNSINSVEFMIGV